MINEPQECCSPCTVSATGLQGRSESVHCKQSLPRPGVAPLVSDSPKADREAGRDTIIIF